MARQLSEIPVNLVSPGTADPEERARLAALGYLSGGAAAGDGPLRNPRDHIQVLGRIQETFALARERRLRESVALCREILREYPEMVDVYNQLAGTLRRLGRMEEAIAVYREAIRRSPQLIDSLAIEVGKLELDRGNLDAAELNAKQAMKLNPAEAHLLLAGIALERRALDDAEREARQALGPEDRPRVPALIMLARILVEEGKLNEALEAIDRAASRVGTGGAPDVPTLASTRGDVLARLGRTKEAEEAFRREIARFPATNQAYVRLAILLASQRRFAEIEPTLQSMLDASPSPRTYILAAQVMSDLGNEVMARRYRRQGEELAARLRASAAAG